MLSGRFAPERYWAIWQIVQQVAPEQEMRLTVDKDNDTLYLRLDEAPVVESEEVHPGVILDFDDSGRVVGIEVLQTYGN